MKFLQKISRQLSGVPALFPWGAFTEYYFVKINLLFCVIRRQYKNPACSMINSRRLPNNSLVAIVPVVDVNAL